MARLSDIVVSVRHEPDEDTVRWQMLVLWALFHLLAEVEDSPVMSGLFRLGAFLVIGALVIRVSRMWLAGRSNRTAEEDARETQRWEADKEGL